jgi:hypothetical protein
VISFSGGGANVARFRFSLVEPAGALRLPEM